MVFMIKGHELRLHTSVTFFLLQCRATGAVRKTIPEGVWVALFLL